MPAEPEPMTRRLRPLLALLALAAPLLARAEPVAGAADSAPTAVTLQKRPTGTFYIPATLEGHGALDLLVDTGSSFLVINEALLARLKAEGRARFSHELNGSMADGSSRVIPVYRLSALRLGDSCWVRDVEAAVFPGSTRPILGMNVLARLAPFTFTADPPQLALHRCQGEAAQAEAAALVSVLDDGAAGEPARIAQ